MNVLRRLGHVSFWGTLTLIAGLAVVALMIILTATTERNRATAPCSSFASYAIGDVPSRCLGYFAP